MSIRGLTSHFSSPHGRDASANWAILAQEFCKFLEAPLQGGEFTTLDVLASNVQNTLSLDEDTVVSRASDGTNFCDLEDLKEAAEILNVFLGRVFMQAHALEGKQVNQLSDQELMMLTDYNVSGISADMQLGFFQSVLLFAYGTYPHQTGCFNHELDQMLLAMGWPPHLETPAGFMKKDPDQEDLEDLQIALSDVFQDIPSLEADMEEDDALFETPALN